MWDVDDNNNTRRYVTSTNNLTGIVARTLQERC
jgi:hypothetical protein